MRENEEKTQSFVPQKKGGVNSIELKKKLIIARFTVIALILLSLCILIFSKVFDNGNNDVDDVDDPKKEYENIPLSGYNPKLGSLIIVNKNTVYSFDETDMVNVKDYNNQNKGNVVNVEGKEITAYTLNQNETLAKGTFLKKEALDAFNKMLVDYCTVKNEESGMSVAWGYSDETSLAEDIKTSETFYDNAVGLTLTIKKGSSAITEAVLQSDFSWIYQNMAKYGFIIRYPNGKKGVTGFDSEKRIHLRYVGVPHAEYMKENNLCLEEYVDLLKSKEGVENAVSFGDYLIFHCEVKDSTSEIQIEKGSAELHSVSGDGANGLIVTLKKNK